MRGATATRAVCIAISLSVPDIFTAPRSRHRLLTGCFLQSAGGLQTPSQGQGRLGKPGTRSSQVKVALGARAPALLASAVSATRETTALQTAGGVRRRPETCKHRPPEGKLGFKATQHLFPSFCMVSLLCEFGLSPTEKGHIEPFE